MKRNPNCQSCPLHEYADTRCLWGEGPKRAKIMAIGEAPGTEEDRLGRPFIGDAGQVLSEGLATVGLRRSQIYITNAAKCHPLKNRNPKKAELDECSPYLETEIRSVRPKFVLLMGNIALKAVLGTTGIEKYRGRPIKEGRITYFPVYHPALILRSPNKKKQWIADLKQFANLVNGVDHKKDIPYKIVNNILGLQDLFHSLKASPAFAYDTETDGLQPMREGHRGIATIQVSTDTETFVLPLQHPESWLKNQRAKQCQIIKQIAKIAKGKKVIAHHGKFDYKWLLSEYGVSIPVTYDTQLAAYLCDENSDTDLDTLISVKIGAPMYSIDLKTKTPWDYPLSVLAEYGAKDTFYTYKLRDITYRELSQDGRLVKLFRKLYIPISMIYAHMELTGIYFDKEKAQSVRRKYGAKVARVQRMLNRIADINWNSPQQVGKVLFDQLNMPPVRYTPTGQRSTDDFSLKSLALAGHKEPKLLLKYRKYTKLLNFIDQWEAVLYKGRVYPSFRLTGTVTGRPSCGDPNLQQVPRDPLIRSILTEQPGYDFLEADYSQMELRLAAERSQDATMMNAYRTGADLHTLTAQRVLGVQKVDKDIRFNAKAVNFGFVYGAFPNTFRDTAFQNYGLVFTLNEAKQFRAAYFDTYPGLLDYQYRQKILVHKYGHVRTFAGRKRRLPIAKDAPFVSPGNFDPDVAHAERQAINSPIQGDVTDFSFMAMIEIWDHFRDAIRDGHFRFIVTVHDSLGFGCKRSLTEHYAPHIKRIMERPKLFKDFGIKLRVPIKADIAVGPWGTGVEI